MRSVAPVLAVLTALGGAAPVWGEEGADLDALCDRCIALNGREVGDTRTRSELNCRLMRDPGERGGMMIRLLAKSGGAPVCDCVFREGGGLADRLAWRKPALLPKPSSPGAPSPPLTRAPTPPGRKLIAPPGQPSGPLGPGDFYPGPEGPSHPAAKPEGPA